MTDAGRPRLALAGRSIVVTRAQEQAGTLATRLAEAGAVVLEVPTIEITDPADGGAALAAAAADLGGYRWVVLTSANGVERVAAALAAGGAAGWPEGVELAVVGRATADAATAQGWPVALVPERFVGEALVEAFPSAPRGGGRVLVAQAQAARPVVVDGLRAAGWSVDAVVAYRTVPVAVDPALLPALAGADAVTFTSASTVRSYVAAAGRAGVPRYVVCIGPVTADAARDAGLEVAAVAAEHTVPGLVAAVVELLGR